MYYWLRFLRNANPKEWSKVVKDYLIECYGKVILEF